MLHYTLNTDHTRVSPRSEVGDDVIARMRPLIEPGQHCLAEFGFPDHSLLVPASPAGLMATLSYGGAAMLTVSVAASPASEDVQWPHLERLYLAVTDVPGMRSADFAAPHKPKSLPWCAVVLVLPTMAPKWAGDFERCLAWTWLDRGVRGLLGALAGGDE